MQVSNRSFSNPLDACSGALYEASFILSSGVDPVTWAPHAMRTHGMDVSLAAMEAVTGRRIIVAVVGSQVDDGAFATYSAPPGATHVSRTHLPFIILPVAAGRDGTWVSARWLTPRGPLSFLSDATSKETLASLPSGIQNLVYAISTTTTQTA